MFAPPPTLNLVVLRSPDIHRAVDFYRRLGLSFTAERHGKGPEHFASSSTGFVLELYPLADGQPPTTSVRIGFLVESIDDLVPMLLPTGAIVVSPPADSPFGRRAVMRDLDGHTVELVSRPLA